MDPLRKRLPLRCNVLLAVLAPAVLIVSCRKPIDEIGLDLLDPADALGVAVVDSTTVVAFPQVEDPLRTSALSRNLLGSYMDREFGLVSAGIVTQLRLPVSNVGAGQDNSGLVADSIVLAFQYDPTGYGYGNLDPQVFRVFELDEPLSLDSIYNHDRIPAHLPEDLVRYKGGLIKPAPLSAAIVGGDTLLPQLRIPLAPSLGQRFLNEWGLPTLASNTAFQEFFKGLWVVADNSGQLPYQGGIFNLTPITAGSKVTIYYRNTLTGDTLAFDLTIDANTQRYTTCTHDRDQLAVNELALALADSARGGTLMYVQGLGGLRTELRFPHLRRYHDAGLRAVAKAELEVNLAGDFYPFYQPPPSLNVFMRSATGTLQVVPDQLAGIGAIGGQYDAANKRYVFNITRYIQGVITGELPDRGLVLVAGAAAVSANRVVLASPTHPEKPMRLRLTFTTY